MEVVTDDLDYPWDIARAGDRIVVTEKGGSIVIVEDGRLSRYPIQTSDPIVDENGAGLLGLTLAPDFADSGLAYFYHTYRTGGRLTNKVIQARFDGRTWQERACCWTAFLAIGSIMAVASPSGRTDTSTSRPDGPRTGQRRRISAAWRARSCA